MERYLRERKCPKCGGYATTVYHKAVRTRDFFHQYLPEHEVIERTCVNCGYKWTELPLDTKEEALR